MKNSLINFYILMLATSFFSIIKISILAYLLPASEFTIYATVFSLVAFASELISFGLTHSTIKGFPRLVILSKNNVVGFDLIRLSTLLILRYAVVFVVCIIIVFIFDFNVKSLIIFGFLVFCYGVNIFSILSSLLRALDKLLHLSLVSVFRSLLILLVSSYAAFFQKWDVVFVAESATVFAICFVIIIYYVILFLKWSSLNVFRSTDGAHKSDLKAARDGGLTLFLAFIVITVPTSLDRLFITHFDSIDTAKVYAFVGIWLTASATIAAIYVQKFGPDMVKALTLNPEIRPLSRTRRNAALLAFMLLLATLLSFGVLNLIFFEAYWQKYNLTWLVVVMAAMAVCVQVTPLFDWTLIALDGERQLLMAACINLGLVVAGFGLCLWTGSGYPGYAAALVVGRIGQIAWSDHAINLLQTRNRLRMTGTFE